MARYIQGGRGDSFFFGVCRRCERGSSRYEKSGRDEILVVARIGVFFWVFCCILQVCFRRDNWVVLGTGAVVPPFVMCGEMLVSSPFPSFRIAKHKDDASGRFSNDDEDCEVD